MSSRYESQHIMGLGFRKSDLDVAVKTTFPRFFREIHLSKESQAMNQRLALAKAPQTQIIERCNTTNPVQNRTQNFNYFTSKPPVISDFNLSRAKTSEMTPAKPKTSFKIESIMEKRTSGLLTKTQTDYGNYGGVKQIINPPNLFIPQSTSLMHKRQSSQLLYRTQLFNKMSEFKINGQILQKQALISQIFDQAAADSLVKASTVPFHSHAMSPFSKKQRIMAMSGNIGIKPKVGRKTLEHEKSNNGPKLQAQVWSEPSDEEDDSEMRLIRNKMEAQQNENFLVWRSREDDQTEEEQKFKFTDNYMSSAFQRCRTPPSPTHSERMNDALIQNQAAGILKENPDLQLTTQQQSVSLKQKFESPSSEKQFQLNLKKQKLVSPQKNNIHNHNAPFKVIDKILDNNVIYQDDDQEEIRIKEQIRKEFKELQFKLFESKEVDQMSPYIMEQLEYFKVLMPGGKDDKSADIQRYQNILLQAYKEELLQQKNFVWKVKNPKGETPLQKFLSRKAYAIKLGQYSVQDPQIVAKEVFEKLKDTEEDVIKMVRNNMCLKDLHLVQGFLSKIQMPESQTRDNLQPERQMFNSTQQVQFFRELCNQIQEQVSIGNTAVSSSLGTIQSQVTNESKQNLKQNLGQKMMQKLNNLNTQTMVKSIKNGIDEEQVTTNQNEILVKNKFTQKFFQSLKPATVMDQESRVFLEFFNNCYVQNRSLGMPVFTNMSEEGTLALVGFKLNPPLCDALGQFLKANNHASSPFIIRKLILDDNNIRDKDFANILKGLVAQKQILHICYSNQNELGPLSLAQLGFLKEAQEQGGMRSPQLNSFKINNIKISNVVLGLLIKNVLAELVQLQSIRISNQRLGQDSKNVVHLCQLIKQSQFIKHLNISNCRISAKDLCQIVFVLPKTLHTLNISSNVVPVLTQKPPGDKEQAKIKSLPISYTNNLLSALKGFISEAHLLTRIDLGDMMLGFKSVFEIVQHLPPNLISLQLSGNCLQKFQLQMIVNFMGIPMDQFEQLTSQKWPPIKRDIYIDINLVNHDCSIQGKSGPLIERELKSIPSAIPADANKNVVDVVNSIIVKQHYQQTLNLNTEDGPGIGISQQVETLWPLLLKKTTESGLWSLVEKCHLAQKWRYCLVFIKENKINQTFFHKANQHQQQELQQLFQNVPDTNNPLLIGNFVQNEAQYEFMSDFSAYWNKLKSQLPKDFIEKTQPQQKHLRQELQEKLEAVGRLNPFIVNCPDVFSEDNPNLEKEIRGFKCYSGYVPPGMQTLIIKMNQNFYFKNLLIDPSKNDYQPVIDTHVDAQNSKEQHQPQENQFLSDWQHITLQDFEFQFQSFVSSSVEIKPIFMDKNSQYHECLNLIKQNYLWLRDFHLEMACMQEYGGLNYPLVNLSKFATLCHEKGTGVIVPQMNSVQEIKETPEKVQKKKVTPAKPSTQTATPKKVKEEKVKENQDILSNEEVVQPLKMIGLYFSDIKSNFRRAFEDQQGMMPGEYVNNTVRNEVCVDFHSFIHTIFKMLYRITQKEFYEQNLGNESEDTIPVIEIKDKYFENELKKILECLRSLRQKIGQNNPAPIQVQELMQMQSLQTMMKQNQVRVIQIYQNLTKNTKKRVRFDQIEFFDLELSQPTLVRCFVESKMLSRMPVLPDERNRWYRELDYTEFMVFLCRAAEYKLTHNVDHQAIVDKIAQIIDLLFSKIV